MFEAIKNLFGFGPKVDFAALIKEGALIVDVRSPGEFKGGNIKGSINIPLNVLAANLSKLKNKDQTIITICASGIRSASAKSILQSNDYSSVYNGGGWRSLQSKI